MNQISRLMAVLSLFTSLQGCAFMTPADLLIGANAFSIRRSASSTHEVVCKPVENSETLLESTVEGTYISDITGQKDYLDAAQDGLVVSIRQLANNRIEGYFGNFEGKIEGTVDGETITFDWYSSSAHGTGEWQIESGSNMLTGTWKVTPENGVSGKWNLKECQLTFVSVE